MKLISTLFLLIAFISCGGSDSSSSSCTKDSCGFCTDSLPTTLKICSIVATPTSSESVTLKNYSTSSIDLTAYTLWDANAYANNNGEEGISGTIEVGASKTFTSLSFVINDSGETIYLKDDNNTLIDSRGF